MRFTYSWLLDCLDTGFSAESIADKLSCIGLEAVVVPLDQRVYGAFVAAEVVEVSEHPSADRLKVCRVFDGTEVFQVVCGAANVRAGMMTVLARMGASIPKNGAIISKTIIRGVESMGMLCSWGELGVSSGESDEGIVDLCEYEVGENFFCSDEVIEIAITPNRGDCLGLYGIARELAAAGMGQLKDLPSIICCEGDQMSDSDIAIDARVDGVLLSGRCIRSVDNKGDTPRWIRDRLISTGIKTVSRVVDIVNYVMFLINRPVHVYDANSIQGKQLIIDNTAGRISALNGKEYFLDDGDVVIRDCSGEIHSIAGVIGSKSSICSRDTRDIFLKSAWYNPVDVSLLSRKLKVTTDSSYRFARHVDPELVRYGLDYATDLITKYCGGSVCKAVTVEHKYGLDKTVVFFSPDSVNKVGNTAIKREKILDILRLLGFGIEEGSAGDVLVHVPSWRCDIACQNDLVEEVIRIYGFEEIHEQDVFSRSLSGNKDYVNSDNVLNKKLRLSMLSQGLTEVVTWSFMSKAVAEKLGFSVEELSIDNPISNQFNIMRPTILPNLLQVAANNHACGHDSVAIFELGSIYVTLDRYEHIICGLRSGCDLPRNPHVVVRQFDFFDLKSDVENLFLQFELGRRDIDFRPSTRGFLHPARSADIYHCDVLCGYIGELHPNLVEFFELKTKPVCFEVFLSCISRKSCDKWEGVFSVNKYQAVKRDFAFILDKNVRSGDLISVIEEVQYVEDVSVFDVYTGVNIPEGKISIAVNVVITSKIGTMTETEIKKVSNDIVFAVGQKLSGQLRLEEGYN